MPSLALSFIAWYKIRMRKPGFTYRILPALILSLAFSCKTPRDGKESPGERNAPELRGKFAARASTIVDSMDTADLAAQVLMVGLSGSASLSENSRALLTAFHPGAIIFFGFNLNPSTEVVAAFTDSICTAARVSEVDPFIAIDHEGGTVFRFKSGPTMLPSAQSIGGSADAEKGAALVGNIAGKELRALGISMNLAPVVEAAAGPAAQFLRWRAWSADPERSGELAGIYLAACQKAGTACAAKHFPGTADADPHSALASLNVKSSELESLYLRPFRQALKSNPALVMLSHVVVPCIDQENPAPLSQALVQGLLKGELGYEGIVLSDDVAMKALSAAGSIEGRVVAALAAGTDMVMISGGVSVRSVQLAILAALDNGSLSLERLRDAASRIVRQKLVFGLVGESSETRKARYRGFATMVETNRSALEVAESGR